MTQYAELKDRVNARQKLLEAKLFELRADTRKGAREEAKTLEAKIEELKTTIKDGWEKVGEDVAGKLNEWLKN